jgi:hypothetical protein
MAVKLGAYTACLHDRPLAEVPTVMAIAPLAAL